jgi:hypothetical protein
MDRMLDDLMGLVLGLAILLIFGVIAAVLYFAFALMVYHMRKRAYERQAQATFEQEAARLGLDLPAEEIIKTVHMAGIEMPDDGYDTIGEWAAGTLFGVSDEVA